MAETPAALFSQVVKSTKPFATLPETKDAKVFLELTEKLVDTKKALAKAQEDWKAKETLSEEERTQLQKQISALEALDKQLKSQLDEWKSNSDSKEGDRLKAAFRFSTENDTIEDNLARSFWIQQLSELTQNVTILADAKRLLQEFLSKDNFLGLLTQFQEFIDRNRKELDEESIKLVQTKPENLQKLLNAMILQYGRVAVPVSLVILAQLAGNPNGANF